MQRPMTFSFFDLLIVHTKIESLTLKIEVRMGQQPIDPRLGWHQPVLYEKATLQPWCRLAA